MELKYNVTGADRKQLVAAISEILEIPPRYCGAPSFAYEADYITIDKTGTVIQLLLTNYVIHNLDKNGSSNVGSRQELEISSETGQVYLPSA